MTSQIERVIANGKPLAVIQKLITEELLRLDKAKFDEELFTQYETAYKTVEVNVDAELDEEGNVLKDAYSYFDYEEDCPTFEEYLNETRVVQEAVEATEDTPAVPEVTELVRPYTPIEVTDEMLQAEIDKLGYVSKEKQDALKYLADTDWYYIRYVDNGEAIPQEVIDKRAEARLIV